jgi:hypothetical protein
MVTPGGSVRTSLLLACLTLGGCSQRLDSASTSKELIPAEWTVGEDTSSTGDITTVSLQLPAAKEISGLGSEEESRLVLRCIDHRVRAFIATEPEDSGIPIELDSVPACD